MEIKDYLVSIGFCNVSCGEMVFRDTPFRYVVASQKITDIQYPIISNTFIVELTNENVNTFHCKDAYQALSDFQNDLISDTFFRCKNDLRWNIYLLFTADNDCIFNNLPVSDFENDDNYARKLFLTTDEAKDFLNRNRFIRSEIDSTLSVSDLQNPLTQWLMSFQSIDLSGVIEEFRSSRVREYIHDNKPFNIDTIDMNTNDVIRSEKSNEFDQIVEIDVSNFRKHCFGNLNKIVPARINLIHGPNGCGKTSILESIEYAITSEIKHIKDFKGTYDGQSSNISISVKDESKITLASEKSKDSCKALDNQWYGAPITKGNGLCTLNSNFNHFNNFSSETIYNFALEESIEDKNYKYLDKFSRLIFNDELIKIQKNWLRYRDEFTSELSSIGKLLEKNNNDINAIKSEILTTEITLGKQSIKNLDILTDVKYKGKIVSSISISDLVIELEKIQKIFKSVERLTIDISTDLANLDLYTISSIQSELININSVLQIEKSKLEEIAKIKSDKEKEIQANRSLLLDLEISLKGLNSHLSNCKEVIASWEKYQHIILNPSVIIEMNRLKDLKITIENKMKLISLIKAKYPNVINVEINSYIPSVQDSIDELRRNLACKKEEMTILENRIQLIEEGLGKVKKLKISLKSIASEIICITDNKNMCPLCGEKYTNNDELLHAIDLTIDLSNKEEGLLAELIKDKELLAGSILSISERISYINERESFINQLNEIIALINDSKLYVFNSSDKIYVMYNQVRAILEDINSLSQEKFNIENVLTAYQNSGYDDITISNANTFIKTNQIISQYVAENKDLIMLIGYISIQTNELYKEIRDKEENINKIDTDIQYAMNQVALLNIESTVQKINGLNDKSNIYLRVEDNFKTLCNYFSLNPEDNFPAWIRIFKKAIIDLDILINSLRLQQSYKLKKDDLARLEEELKINLKSFERCSNACVMFSQLKELKDYSHDFIQENKKRIETFFKLLHTPREFKSLDLTDDGIIAIRTIDNKTIKMHQMSTGQRTSLAISLILSLYIAARNAPKFLIFDEPVANLDDLHLLNLLDIIRDFAFSGTQIFFTTANPEVAGIFRRKFSFFASQFKHFELSRVNNGFTNLKVVKYIPDSEMGEIQAS